MNESEIIAKYLVNLTHKNKLALGLKDDIAMLSDNLIIKTDTTIESVHIFESLPANFVAYKAMARCFSDIFAKNGEIVGYLTNIILPKGFQKFDEFFAGFSQFAKEYSVDLLGGDLSTHNAKNIIVTVTVVAKSGKITPRFGSKIGDELYLTKKIGSAYLGFLDVQNGNLTTENAKEYLMPSLVILEGFQEFSATMDISDGLIADATKMAKASGVCFEIDYNLLPFVGGENCKEMLSFGDDYNILICSQKPVKNANKIGIVKQGQGLNLKNVPFEIAESGYDHFAK